MFGPPQQPQDPAMLLAQIFGQGQPMPTPAQTQMQPKAPQSGPLDKIFARPK